MIRQERGGSDGRGNNNCNSQRTCCSRRPVHKLEWLINNILTFIGSLNSIIVLIIFGEKLLKKKKFLRMVFSLR